MTVHALTLVAALAFSGPQSAGRDAGAPPLDERWTPWFGCWQLLDESTDEGAADLARLLGVEPPRSTANAGALVCVTPAAGAGATFTTFVNDQAVLTETIVANGRQIPLTESGCQGWQRADWSPRAPRLYASAEIACAGQSPRRVSGMALMSAGPRWLDIQLIESDGRKNLRVRRYVRAADQTRASTGARGPATPATMPRVASFSVADVMEASAHVAPETLEAALVELRVGFNLNGQRLIELGEAGVPPSVIDLMVALSFPEKFVVEQRGGGFGGGGFGGGGFGGGGFGGGGFWPVGDDPMWPYYNHPSFYTSYYAPFGYRYWGGYDSYYFAGPGFVILNPDSPGIQPSGDGRVVDGRGYTRVRRNTPDPATPRTAGGGWSTASAGDSSSGSSGSTGGGVSSSGYSGSGSSGGGGRTAQPRPPGG